MQRLNVLEVQGSTTIVWVLLEHVRAGTDLGLTLVNVEPIVMLLEILTDDQCHRQPLPILV